METNNTTTSNGVHNAHAKDNAAKIVFGDPVLCAQFLKGYTDIPLFKEIKPEDIENISSHFLPLFQESRDSDTVNKIRIGNSEIYLIALIEHQSENDFDMSFRILRYIVFIWTDYAAQQEKLHKGITKSKAFLYPPILPIVYYEGTSTWSAPLNFKDRVFLSDAFGDYIPSFNYLGRTLTAAVSPVVEHIVVAHIASVRLSAYKLHEGVTAEVVRQLPGFCLSEPHQRCLNHYLTVKSQRE